MQSPLDTGPGGPGDTSSSGSSGSSGDARPPMPAMRTRDGKPLEVAARVQLLWVLLVASVLVTVLSLPFRLASGVLSLVACWVAVTVLVRVARARRIGLLLRKRSWPIGVGLGLGVVLTFSSALDAAFYPIVADREECVAGANTSAAQQECLTETEDRLTSWAESLTGR